MAEVAREHGWHPPKSLDSEENFKPEHTLFCRELRFVLIYALFGDLWAKKVPFWVKNSVLWARSALLHSIYCILYCVKFANLQLRAKATLLEIVNTRLTKICMANWPYKDKDKKRLILIFMLILFLDVYVSNFSRIC